MNKFIRKVIALTMAFSLFISVSTFGAINIPPNKSVKEVMKIALNMDRIIENDFIELRNLEAIQQAYKLDNKDHKEYEPSKQELDSLSLIDLYHIDRDYLKRRMSYMKVRELRKQVKIGIRYFSSIYEMDVNLIMAIVKKESYFNPRARSHKHAEGLMQLMKATAIEMGVKDRFNPFENLEGGIKYFKKMLVKFGNEELALAAYNAGPYNVIKYKGIPPFSETRDYVKTILEYRKEYTNAYRGTV